MSGSNQLLLAVPALDSYNRGYNRQLNVSGVTIGGRYGDMIRIALFVGRINEEGIGVVQIGDCISCPRNS